MKIQILRDGQWTDINQNGFYNISKGRAQTLADEYNQIQNHFQYRAVPDQTPQEPATPEELQKAGIQVKA